MVPFRKTEELTQLRISVEIILLEFKMEFF